jgi:hypothetical protein
MDWSKVRDDARGPMRQLYEVMVGVKEKGRKDEDDKQKIRSLRTQLRGIGVLSMPFSLNIKKF